MRERSCKREVNTSKNTTKVLAGALAALFVVSALIGCSGGAGAYADSNELFTDVKSGHWAYGSIDAMVKAGAVNGYPDGTFRPSENVTYGEFIKMMYTALNGNALMESESAGSKEHWAVPYYYAALAEKYFDASSIEIGLLDKKMPRKHMAHAAACVVRASAQDTDTAESQSSAGNSGGNDSIEFSDVLPTGEYAYDIMTACGSGILSGYPDGTFGGNGTLTRAEATSVIRRLSEYKAANAVTGEKADSLTLGEAEVESTILPGEKKSGKKIIRKVEKADRVIPVSYEVIDSTFRAKGIEKIEYDGTGAIKIYSSVEYPFIRIMKEDGKLMKSIGSPDGSFFKEDGMYVYLADPDGEKFDGLNSDGTISELYLILDDESGRVYRFSGQ